jgi:hypothetical protein
MSELRVRVAVVTAIVAVGASLFTPARAADGAAATVGDVAEAWYATAPVDVCTTPLGCDTDQSTSPYPADTLHVGVAGGQESARSYVLPDFGAVPSDATMTAGTMTLPLASGTGDGTSAPETAELVGCLAKGAIVDGSEGSTAPPPEVDCSTSVQAHLDDTRNVFTLDLAPFLRAWRTGRPRYGIALVPAPDTSSPTAAWHVAFNGRERADVPVITSVITFEVAQPAPSTADTDAATTLAGPPPAAPTTPGFAIPGGPAPTTPTTQHTVAVAPGAQPTASDAFSQAFGNVPRPFRYPAVFAMPLVLMVAALFLARLFTRDATPVRLDPMSRRPPLEET